MNARMLKMLNDDAVTDEAKELLNTAIRHKDRPMIKRLLCSENRLPQSNVKPSRAAHAIC